MSSRQPALEGGQGFAGGAHLGSGRRLSSRSGGAVTLTSVSFDVELVMAAAAARTARACVHIQCLEAAGVGRHSIVADYTPKKTAQRQERSAVGNGAEVRRVRYSLGE